MSQNDVQTPLVRVAVITVPFFLAWGRSGCPAQNLGKGAYAFCKPLLLGGNVGFSRTENLLCHPEFLQRF